MMMALGCGIIYTGDGQVWDAVIATAKLASKGNRKMACLAKAL